jgi:hypothetical protein
VITKEKAKSIYRKYGLLGAAGALAGLIWLIALSTLPNPNPTSAQYLLSSIPQVIGAVFVLTIAVIQIVGVGGKESLWGLLKKWEVKFTFSITLIGITLPLIALYFKWFCVGTAISLGYLVGNLLVIAWLIWQLAPLSAIKRLARLKKELEEAIELDLASEILTILDEVTKLGLQAISERNIAVLRDVCVTISGAATNETFRNKGLLEIWKKLADCLITLNDRARSNEATRDYNSIILSRFRRVAVMIIASKDLGTGEDVNTEYISPSFEITLKYLFERFEEDLGAGRIDFEEVLKTLPGFNNDHFGTLLGYISGYSKPVDGIGRLQRYRGNIISQLEDCVLGKSAFKEYDKYLIFAIISFILHEAMGDVLGRNRIRNQLEYLTQELKENPLDFLNKTMEVIQPFKPLVDSDFHPISKLWKLLERIKEQLKSKSES